MSEVAPAPSSTTVWGRGVRHYALEDVEDVRKAQEYLRRSWELLGILLASPETVRKAVEANCVERWALEWCRGRGLVE